ncbi:hypothetical protein Fmac_002987 [Flemingia macrophylla]|uniref:Legume lectin domain-containing protein n=1 Tax=Flemingia macrophylla TaxID=520843 RepID=A0ABD1NLH0_9FABA
MATNISSPPNLVSLLLILISFLMILACVSSASFSFSSFGPYTKDITFQGDASTSNGALQLTNIGNGSVPPTSAGRASYAAPVHLWDSKRGELHGFTTTFSFVVAPTGPGPFGDGISFFMAPFNSDMHRDSSGGFLGLFKEDSAFNAYKNQIVAVEFDFCVNTWDLVSPYIGIDINSIVSAKIVAWQNENFGNETITQAVVSYEPVTKTLSVFSYPHIQENQNNVSSTSLSFMFDLRIVLPEWIRVGFSGATRQLVEVHRVLSWSFNSSVS